MHLLELHLAHHHNISEATIKRFHIANNRDFWPCNKELLGGPASTYGHEKHSFMS